MVDAFLASVRNKIKVHDSRMRTLRPDEVASVKKIRKRISVLQEKILKAQAAMKRTKRALKLDTEKKSAGDKKDPQGDENDEVGAAEEADQKRVEKGKRE